MVGMSRSCDSRQLGFRGFVQVHIMDLDGGSAVEREG
jgi:hypothetical protein